MEAKFQEFSSCGLEHRRQENQKWRTWKTRLAKPTQTAAVGFQEAPATRWGVEAAVYHRLAEVSHTHGSGAPNALVSSSAKSALVPLRCCISEAVRPNIANKGRRKILSCD